MYKKALYIRMIRNSYQLAVSHGKFPHVKDPINSIKLINNKPSFINQIRYASGISKEEVSSKIQTIICANISPLNPMKNSNYHSYINHGVINVDALSFKLNLPYLYEVIYLSG
ncbi:4692_t:CDS:2 [Entrophospora sp. SA101]|nr:4692_t:CDS:2 [Entrophospora sp. SA101]